MDDLLGIGIHTAWLHCWQVTLLIAAVWLIIRLAAPNRPHLASVLWLAVLIKCLTPPLWSSPCSIFSRVQPVQSVTQRESVPGARSGHPEIAYQEPIDNNAGVVVRINRSQSLTLRDLPRDADPQVQGVLARLLQGILTFSGLITLFWLLGSIGFALLAGLRGWRCWNRLRRAGDVDSPAVQQLATRLSQRLGVRHPVRVVVSRSPVGPAVIGLWRPTVILPSLIVEAKSIAELEPLLAHEIIHIRRGDLWVGLLQLLVQGLWWFHPLVRGVNRLLTREAERCCDEAVIAYLGCGPGQYARSLIDVLELKRTLYPVPLFPGVRPVDVTSQRLERIMKLGQGCRRQTPRWCWLVMLLTISATVPGAAFIAAQDKPVVSGKPLDPLSPVVANEPLAASPNPAPNAPQMVKIYALRSLLEQARRDLGENDANVRQVISDQLRQAAKPRQDDPQLVVEMQSQIPAKTVVTSEPPLPSLVWSETDLMIDTTADAHQRIAERLAEMGESGLVSIQVETRLITGPTAAIDRISAAWNGLGQVAAQPVADLPLPDRIEGQLAPSQPRIFGYAQTTIEKNVPVNCAVASPELLRTIVNQSQADARSNIMFAPRVTVFSGQPATIEDAVIRPFVVGRQTAEQGAAPVVRLYKEGWILNVRPMAVKNDRVRLNLRLVRSEILDVQTARLTTSGAQPEMMIQIPEQSVTKIQTVVELQPGQSILMGGLQTWVPTLTRRTGTGRTGGNDAGPDTNPREPFLIVVSVNKVKAGSGGPPAALKAVSPAPHLDDQINMITPPPARQSSSDDAAAPLSKPKPERVADPATTVLETRAYSVADLVIPVLDAKLYREQTTDTGSNTDATEAKPDFAPLKDLIVKTIAPDSWDQNGGPGALRSFDSTLSLVVRQTAAIHEEVEGLLSQIRSLQDIQVSFGVERLTLVPSDFQAWLEKIDLKTRQKLKLESGCLAVNLCGPDAESLRRLAGGENRGPALRITLMNGQLGEFPVAVKDAPTEGVLNWLQLTPSVTPDLQRLRMNVAGGMADHSGHLAAKRTAIAMLNHGDFLLVDLATESFPEVDSGDLHPILKQLPYSGALFKKSNSESPQPAAQRQFFLLTPKIVVVREETEANASPQPEKAK